MFLFLFWGASAEAQVVTGGGRAGRQEEQYQKTWYQHKLEQQWDKVVADKIHQAAVDLGRKGGLAGGRARAEALTQRQRTAIATLGAKTRWK